MNWYRISKKRKYEDERNEGDKIDNQLLCCGFPENKRTDPYKKNKGKNYPDVENNKD